MFALRYRGDQKGGKRGREAIVPEVRARREVAGTRKSDEKEGVGLIAGFGGSATPLRLSGERGGLAAVEVRVGCGEGGRASERAQRRRGVSRKERAEGSRSFAGDGKRNRGRPRWIERVEIDAKDGDDESERAAAVAAAVTGGTKGGKGEILLTYTPTLAEVRARRDGLMRGRVRGKRNDDSG